MTERTKQAIELFRAMHTGDPAAIMEVVNRYTKDNPAFDEYCKTEQEQDNAGRTREEAISEIADSLERLRIIAIEEIRAEIAEKGVTAFCEEVEPLIYKE